MVPRPVHVVTGAFGFTGRHIARRLVEAGCSVRTLTNSQRRGDALGERISAEPFHFDDFGRLVDSLRGADVLYNTYWVRFNHATFTHAQAVENSAKLFAAAREAGVQRVVHISITNASEDSHLEYFRGKAVVERSLIESGLSHAILRPALLFGEGGILVNNIAWLLRRFPMFGVFGGGEYRLQPIHVDDLAELAIKTAAESENLMVDAVGPETFSYRQMVEEIGHAIGVARPIVGVPPRLGHLVGVVVGALLGDVVITWEEIDGLMSELLYTDSPPVGTTRLTEWARQNAGVLGRRYACELASRRKA